MAGAAQQASPARPRTIAMIIARMGSTRLPGKSLVEIAGMPLLDHMIVIAGHLKRVDGFAVVTSSLPIDDPIARLAESRSVAVVRGHPDYVLDRVEQAAAELAADVIVYIGGDCPLLDPAVLDSGIEVFFARGCDYLNNYEPPTFPEGMDVNVITRAAVKVAHARAVAPSQRIHAFSYLTRHPDEFTVSNFEHATDLSAHHWSLDFPDDLSFIRAVYSALHRPGRAISMNDVLSLIGSDPQIAAMDQALQRGRVAHAFWNSPGIMRDMASDIGELATQAESAMAAGDRAMSRRCFEEIARIAGELARFVA